MGKGGDQPEDPALPFLSASAPVQAAPEFVGSFPGSTGPVCTLVLCVVLGAAGWPWADAGSGGDAALEAPLAVAVGQPPGFGVVPVPLPAQGSIHTDDPRRVLGAASRSPEPSSRVG